MRGSPKILIVGAGPTGLTMANLLARQGVLFRLIDKNSGPNPESRALVVQARTLELFRSMGIAGEAISRGLKGIGLDLYARGRKAASVDLGAVDGLDTPYPFALILEQNRTEEILVHALKTAGGDVEWESSLEDFHVGETKIKARIEKNGKAENTNFDYLIACDGASSPIRHALGVPFEGGTYEHTFLLADTKLSGLNAVDRISLFMTAMGPLVFVPMVGTEYFRVITVLPPEHKGDSLGITEVRDIVRELSGMDINLYDPRWITVYRLHHRRARAFANGRCFLVGDAAHIHSPAGGQGMNTGIQDAWNLAWKLAFTIKRNQRKSLLKSYHEERYPVAGQLLKFTDRLFAAAVSSNPILIQARLRLAPYALRFVSQAPWARRRAIHRISQLDVAYRKSPLVEQFDPRGRFLRSTPRPGDRAPPGEIVISTKHEKLNLLDLLGPEKLHLLVFDCGGDYDIAEFDPLLREYAEVLDHHRLIPMSLENTAGGCPRLNDEIHSRYTGGRDCLYLVRPDGYISFRAIPISPRALESHLRRLLGD